MNPVILFFKKFDATLNACVDYFDYRIRTGKFIDDIKYYNNQAQNLSLETGKKVYYDSKKSNNLYVLIHIFKFFFKILIKIPLLAVSVTFLYEAVTIGISCYAEIFIVFAFTFPLTILLLNLFQSDVIAFLICLIPILFLNIYCVSALYYFLFHKEKKGGISLWQSFRILAPRFYSLIFPALTQSAIIQESLLGFIISALFLSYLFELLNISWSGSFVYWFIIFSLLFILLIGIFVFSMIMYQTFFSVLLENLSFQLALKRSKNNVYSYLSFYSFFYFLFYIVFAFIIWKAAVLYLYLGVTIGLFSACTILTFLAFLLWNRFRPQIATDNEFTQPKTSSLFMVIILFGFINYLLLAILFVKEYQPFIVFVQQQENNFLASQDMKQYANNIYHYSLRYPQAWTIYEWNNTSTTFYNNYTGTISGGTWMTVTVSSFNSSTFVSLLNAEPGRVEKNGTTQDMRTKITNMSVQGYDTINYTLVKRQLPYTQYETHYLIHKGNLLYDIAFISLTNDVASYNSDLFQVIINSFQFTQ
jgi:hypothetical protein